VLFFLFISPFALYSSISTAHKSCPTFFYLSIVSFMSTVK
jgi:hypothetical protein